MISLCQEKKRALDGAQEERQNEPGQAVFFAAVIAIPTRWCAEPDIHLQPSARDAGRRRRLSLCSPASLETESEEASRAGRLLCPVPERQGLAGGAA